MLTEVQAEPKPQVVNLKPVLTEPSQFWLGYFYNASGF